MLSKATPLRSLRIQPGRQVAQKRFASHGAPHYNEPSGNIFGEKVTTIISFPSRLLTTRIASTSGTKAGERGLGEYMVYWDVRYPRINGTSLILQARHQVRSTSVLFMKEQNH
jgi:hypothetical protein